ncbi:hypothetical protein Vadar_015981 [Vaccinium darrowii]|uniref:Uncharacterized protein n=1 Tax=Vaccinium darrowii TaxID=229202 RepID=A0ACB7XZS7_9ERIC|nr:hypothetical protein Vadar_015981 [Vaccinium darrowii]
MKSLLEGRELSWFNKWFEEVHQWSIDLPNVKRRYVWLSCYGVPLHGWSVLTFRKIAQLWGEVVMVDDATVKGLSYAAGKIMIATETWETINEIIQLEVKGKLFQVRVVEEQVVVQGHCSTCNLNSTESSEKANSPAMENLGDPVVNSVDEVASKSLEDRLRVGATRSSALPVNSNCGSGVEETALELGATGNKDMDNRTLVLLKNVASPEKTNEEEGEIGGDFGLDLDPEFNNWAQEIGVGLCNEWMVPNSIEHGLGDSNIGLDTCILEESGPILTERNGPSIITSKVRGMSKVKPGASLSNKAIVSGAKKKTMEEILGLKESDDDLPGGGRRRKKAKQGVGKKGEKE